MHRFCKTIFARVSLRTRPLCRNRRRNLQRPLCRHHGRHSPRHRERRGRRHGDRIVAVGTRAEIDKQYQPRQRLDRPDAILMPGLINTHTHAAMSLLRGIADDLTCRTGSKNTSFPPKPRTSSADFVLWGTRLACLEMMLSGTTTYVDMYYFEDRVAQATKEAGMRGVLGETIIGFNVPDAKPRPTRCSSPKTSSSNSRTIR